MRTKSLFYKKIKCKICNGKGGFKKKVERQKRIIYVCSNYENKKTCRRIPISEELLKSLINKRYNRELSDEEIRNVVVEVIIKSELYFDIVLTEGKPISFHERGIVF